MSTVVWAGFNLLIGLFELYGFLHRKQLVLAPRQQDILMRLWSEYTRADNRYIYKPYVWAFELANLALACWFVYAVYLKFTPTIITILWCQVVNCSLYFITLVLDKQTWQSADPKVKWPYYGISSLWLIIPGLLLFMQNTSRHK